MIKLCEACRYEFSDCKGEKNNPQDCPYYAKPVVLNAKKLAMENEKLRRDLQFIYQVHRRGGEWEDAYDYIEGTYRHEANARAKVEELMAEQIKVVKANKKCCECDYDKECFKPDDFGNCDNETRISLDYLSEEYYIVNVLVDDWRDAE